VVLTATGREIAVEAALARLDEVDGSGEMHSGEETGAGSRQVVLFARDISQRHALETIKDDFIATVSHELRTPLSAVVGAVEALQHQEGIHLPAEARHLLNLAAEGGERLQRLIDTILNLQKMDTGGIDFVPKPVRASTLIAAALDGARAAAATQGKFLANKRLPDDVLVKADARWIHEVLMNLIDNALKYSPTAATVVCGAEVTGSRVRFSVIDQGTGVPHAFASQVFQRFARADTSNTRVYGGAGLGLSVCKAVVEGCGGTIGYQNNDVKGATFWFELPLLQLAPPA
jgi:signal transduction histidine kinase